MTDLTNFSATQRINALLRFFAKPRLFAYSLLWLMVILIAGTVAEKNFGLYRAEQIYFSSYIIWLWNIIPLPGLLTVTIFIFIGLIARLALEQWRWKNLGTIVIHIGAALLLFGGFVTLIVSRESVMVIPQGETRDYSEDLRHVELAVTDLHDTKAVNETVFSEQDVATGNFKNANLPFTIELVSWCRNCALVRLPHAVTDGQPHGVAINFVLKNSPYAAEDENNRAGLTFRLHGTPDKDGLYAVFQDMPIREIVTVNNRQYYIDIRKRRYPLPFAIQLEQFKEELYPGTSKPRSYQSQIIVNDNGVVWPSLIQMNEPLRYKGYTFYQSSFMEGDGKGTTTVLTVVKNSGRLFPYISGIVIAIGFAIHLVQRLVWRRQRGAA